jgi:LCP family protein required for cell wall assembly
MFSLPRNLNKPPMPPGPLKQTWPDRFPTLLNAVYKYVTDDPHLLAGARDRGAEALKQVTGYVLGLRVDYYVMINLQGFEEFVNALGGVTMNVPRRLPIGGILADGTHVAPSGYIEAGVQHLNGFKALWFSRSRSDSTDYERMGRQRCLIGAIAKQVSPASMLTHFQKLASATKNLVETDLPQALLQPMVDLADKIRGKTDIRSVQFVPPLINTGDPDFDLIRTKVRQAIAPPPARPRTTPTTPPPTATTTPTKPPTSTGTRNTSSTDIQSVDEACALH